jgi:predicted nucleic acid-binding protein
LKIIVDSDIFITHFRLREESVLLAQLSRRSLWYMSSVVAMELRSGCRTPTEVRFLTEFLYPFERTRRVVSPDHRMWIRAGEIVADLPNADRSRRQRLVHDSLIALSAVSIGACVVTANRRDFETLSAAIPVTFFGSVSDALAEAGS